MSITFINNVETLRCTLYNDNVDGVDDLDDLGKYCLVGQTPGEPKFSFRLWGNLLHHVSNIPKHWWSLDDTDSGGKQYFQKIF